MKGLLATKGIRVAESTVGASLQHICPKGRSVRRTNSVNHLSPVRYAASYFGYKLHTDQNEKLIAFGVTRGTR